MNKTLRISSAVAGAGSGATVECQNGRVDGGLPGVLCHSGIAKRLWSTRFLGTHLRTNCLLVFGCLLADGPAQAPTFEVVLRSGEVLRATAPAGSAPVSGDWPGPLAVATADGVRRVAGAEVLALLGCPGAALDLPVVTLAGGEQLCGSLVGGDAQGERFTVHSPALGPQSFPVDRLAALAGPGPDRDRVAALVLPRGVDEALVRRVPLGFDWLSGTLHRFGSEGIRFQTKGEDTPRWFAVADVLGLRLGAAAARATPPAAWLCTRTGDRLGVQVEAFDARGLRCRLETDEQVLVHTGDVASVVFLGAHTFASDLQPSEVAESGHDGDVLWPWRRDQAATGGWLVAAGRTYAKGLGVHSRSRLVFRAPAGSAAFWTRVAFDDSAAALPVQGRVDVRISVDGKLRFEHRDLQVGRAPLDPGLLPVTPGATVALEVDCGKGRDLGDRIDWLLPVFLPAAESR